MFSKIAKKCTAKINTENPDPDPTIFENAGSGPGSGPGSGSGSVYNVYRSATLVFI